MLRRIALVIGLALAGSAHADEPRVLTSIKPLQLIASAVLDGIATPELLLPVGASPHSYALKPSERRALDQAQRVYWIGPEMELFLESLLSARDTDIELMHAAGVTLRPLSGDHDGHESEHADHDEAKHDEHAHDEHDHGAEHEAVHHDDHHVGTHDAHIWLSPDNAQAIARTMAADLATHFPQHSERLRANLTHFERQLEALDSQLQERFEPLSSKPYFVFHDGYGYFEDHYGLKPRGIFSLSHEVQPGARHVAELRNSLQKAGPSCVFSEPQFTPRLIESLTAGLPVHSAELDPLGSEASVDSQGYVEFMQTLGANLAGCLEAL